MKLIDYIEADNLIYQSPGEPNGADWYEYWHSLTPISTFKPPSLKNPQYVKVPTNRDGWHPGDSKKARQEAIKDLVEIHKRLLRNKINPMYRTAEWPVYPNIQEIW